MILPELPHPARIPTADAPSFSSCSTTATSTATSAIADPHLDDAEEYIQQAGGRYARHGHGLYLVMRREDEARIGICGSSSAIPAVRRHRLRLPASLSRSGLRHRGGAGRRCRMGGSGSVSSGSSPSSPWQRAICGAAGLLGLVRSRLVRLSEDADECLLLEAADTQACTV